MFIVVYASPCESLHSFDICVLHGPLCFLRHNQRPSLLHSGPGGGATVHWSAHSREVYRFVHLV